MPYCDVCLDKGAPAADIELMADENMSPRSRQTGKSLRRSLGKFVMVRSAEQQQAEGAKYQYGWPQLQK